MPAEESLFRVLQPYDPREGMLLRHAATRADKSESTVKNWCRDRGIGRRVAGGVWIVSRVALEMLLADDDAALFCYHYGDRSDPIVQRYFVLTGVPFRNPAVCQTLPKTTFLANSTEIAG